MRQSIHPVVGPTVYSCGRCSTQFKVESTRRADLVLDVCSNCHPAYTGKEMKSVTNNRIESFNNRYKLN